MNTLITKVKTYFTKRAQAKRVNATIKSLISVFRQAKTSTGFKFDLPSLYSLDFGKEYREIYQLGDFIIDTFSGFSGDLVIVARAEFAGERGSLISVNGVKPTIAFTDRHHYRHPERQVMDLTFNEDELFALQALLDSSLIAQRPQKDVPAE